MLLGLVAAPAASATGGYNLIGAFKLDAGQTYNVGHVNVYLKVDGGTPYVLVRYDLNPGWVLKEAHLAMGHSAVALPTNPAGAAVPGKFPWAAYPGTEDYDFVVQPHGLCDLVPLYIAAHAVVSNGSMCETAWGVRPCYWSHQPANWSISVAKFARGWATYGILTPSM